ncbi:fimbrial protein FimV [Methylomonas sp. SURF-2]|uniref:Fimbrial protein FimV n=1 Tax=Methylomonas subterranea TaxID=2952225 RepID=A0ABT1TAQ8_9GAMM|nr:FimV/HubP family polar landmark protein [Methylomonas sp. SURF-2]MCQ8102533.1 fimbrial protein FimV [Methylomonas sp. SURF-2]
MSAQPLGIGDIQLHSALNQKLNAEIHLRLAAGENPADVTVKLAPPEKFDQAGVPWNYFLSKIKFNPVVQADGSIIVKVTSREPLTEPFLDFLLEVTWPQGSQYREFTVLIDPPEAYRAPALPSTAGSDYRLEALEDYVAPTRKPKPARTGARRDTAANITPQTPSSGEYGPTRTADTLWRIANQLGNERGVPTSQMMAALFNANPEAFNHGNIDSLKTGMVLKIPETEAILQSSGKRGEIKPRKPAAETVAGAKALELVAPSDTKITDSAVAGGKVKPGGDGNATTEGTGGGTADGKDLDLQSRIDRLEQQLNMMQQLLALKDQQLATLQHKDQDSAQQQAESTQVPPAQPAEPSPPPPPAPAEPAAPEQASVPAPTAEPPVTAAQPEAPVEIKPAPVPAPPKPVRPTPPPPAPIVVEEESFLSSPSYSMVIGGLSVGIMGLLGWLLWRKRKIESQTNTESMFASASQIKMPDADSSLAVPVMDINSTGAYDVGTVGESSFISDFTPSDFEAFDTDQNDIDPMSEADVYLAYGRYQQAEDLIRHAIKDQPEKDDYKLKLLEIFYANENRERFAEYTQELADAGKNADRAFWSKVTDMAKEIIPESALFGGSVPQHKPAPVSDDIAANNLLDREPAHFETTDDLSDLETPALPDMELMDEINSELAEMQLTLPEEPDHGSLDFDLGSFEQAESESKPKDELAEPAPDIETIDFDLSGLQPDSADEEKTKASETLESFDFNFELDSATDAAGDKTRPDEDKLDLASLESFEFPEFAEEEPKKTPVEPVSETLTSGSDEFDFNFDFETPASKSLDDDMDFGVADLTDMDEFETKIDLAKAYIDMGDAEAARTIATEVLAKGSPEQKQAAQAILDELN